MNSHMASGKPITILIIYGKDPNFKYFAIFDPLYPAHTDQFLVTHNE